MVLMDMRTYYNITGERLKFNRYNNGVVSLQILAWATHAAVSLVWQGPPRIKKDVKLDRSKYQIYILKC